MPSPDSRRVLGDVANAPRAPSSPVLALAAKLSTPSPVVSSETFDGWRVNANPSFSPSAEVTERASMPPKSPAEELAHRAALAAAKIRRGGSTSPPDYASHATPSPTERPRRSGSGSGSASGSERSKISSAERAKRMASHAERAYDDPGIVDGEHSPPSSDADDALRALEAELSVGGVGSNFTLDADRVDAATPNAKRSSKNATPTTSKESKESKESKTGSADSFTFDAAATRPEPSSSASASGGSPFVRLVAVDAVDGEEDDAPESGESGETGGGEKNPTGGSSGAGSAPGGSAGNARGGDERTGRGSSRGGDESNGGGGDVSGFGRGGFGGGGGGDASPPFPGTSRERLVSSTLPADAGVTLASALGRWREAVAVAAVVSDAANTRDELTEILREQAETCDEEVNHLTDEVDALTAALSESASENLRLRWRWAAKASLASVKAEEYRGEARRLRAKALKLESQLLKVEAHITSAAADFDRLRGRLTESTRETERARASEAKAREQLAAAQSAAAAAQSAAAEAAARADAYDKTAAELSRRSPLKENHGATPGGDEEAMRAAIRAELRDDARARIRAGTSRGDARGASRGARGGASRGGGGRGCGGGGGGGQAKDRSRRRVRHGGGVHRRSPPQRAIRADATGGGGTTRGDGTRAREPRGGGAGWRGDAPSRRAGGGGRGGSPRARLAHRRPRVGAMRGASARRRRQGLLPRRQARRTRGARVSAGVSRGGFGDEAQVDRHLRVANPGTIPTSAEDVTRAAIREPTLLARYHTIDATCV